LADLIASYSAGFSINNHPIVEAAVILLLMTIYKRTAENKNIPSEMESQDD
jgi:hypothetical protein